jgi:hypothetical protein
MKSDAHIKTLLAIIAINLTIIAINLSASPAVANQPLTKVVICDQYGNRCADVGGDGKLRVISSSN